MKKYSPVIILWLINSFIIWVVDLIVPNLVVLGNSWIKGILAALWFGILITFADHIAKYINKKYLKLKGRNKSIVYYLAVNIVAIWLLARIPNFSAFGIIRYYWAIVLGVTLNLMQWLVRQGLKKGRLI